MRLRLAAALILAMVAACLFASAQTVSVKSSAVESTLPVRVRWIVDIKKKLGYENFDRAEAEHSPWKSQQGIAYKGQGAYGLADRR